MEWNSILQLHETILIEAKPVLEGVHLRYSVWSFLWYEMRTHYFLISKMDICLALLILLPSVKGPVVPGTLLESYI